MEPRVLAADRGSPRGAVRVTRISCSSIRIGYGYYGGIACAPAPHSGLAQGGESFWKEIFYRAKGMAGGYYAITKTIIQEPGHV
jgi:hypothetical protein